MWSRALDVFGLNILEHFSYLVRATRPWHLTLFGVITWGIVDDFLSCNSKYYPQQRIGVEMFIPNRTFRFQRRLLDSRDDTDI
jgi:hypothetical protein